MRKYIPNIIKQAHSLNDNEQNSPTKDETSRNEAIFNAELIPHIDALFNFAIHLTYDEERANDLVQETYMKAWRFISSFESGTNGKAWLFKILKNAFINEYRKQAKQPTKVDFEDAVKYYDSDEGGSVGYLDLSQDIFQGMLGDEVSHALDSLPVDFRTVVLLCDIEGFTYEEIAKIIDIPIGTVRSRLHRARGMLKSKLEAYAQKMGYTD